MEGLWQERSMTWSSSEHQPGKCSRIAGKFWVTRALWLSVRNVVLFAPVMFNYSDAGVEGVEK